MHTVRIPSFQPCRALDCTDAPYGVIAQGLTGQAINQACLLCQQVNRDRCRMMLRNGIAAQVTERLNRDGLRPSQERLNALVEGILDCAIESNYPS